MTRRGFLDASRVRHWVGGVEPAWTALTYESFNALYSEPSATNMSLRLANDLTADELDASAVTHNTLVLLHHAAQADGLKLTASGNIARSVVAEMIDLFDWPDFNKTEARQLNKVINEPDFLPVHFVRLVAEAARLVRPSRLHEANGSRARPVEGAQTGSAACDPLPRRRLALQPELLRSGPARRMAAARHWHYLVVTLRRRVGLGISGETDEALRDPDQRCLGRAVGQRINGDGGKSPPICLPRVRPSERPGLRLRYPPSGRVDQLRTPGRTDAAHDRGG